MSALPKAKRDLAFIRETCSTARVLNLVAIYFMHQDKPEWSNQPLFRNRRMNTSIIVKHAVRPHERAQFQNPPITATKIIFPFALTDLGVGGSSVFVGQNDYVKTLRGTVGGNDDPSQFDADVRLLQALDGLPSFDPFLMRERLREGGFSAARCYFDVSEADLAKMRSFVRSEIGRLVELAFSSGGGGTAEMSAKLADMLMTDETADSLAPLRATLRLSGDEYREGVFAWKGFLYYKWLYSSFAERVPEVVRLILAARIQNATRNDQEILAATRQRIGEFLGAAAMHIDKSLREYDVAFGRLADGSPNAFREFLLRAPGMFIFLGQAVGVIQHVESYWRYRYPKFPAMIDVEDAHAVFHEFLASLGGTEAVRDFLRTRV